jgi:hypothetical protein
MKRHNKPARIALVNGNVITLNPAHPKAEAVAIRDERIVGVGTNEEVSQLVGRDAKIINLKGKTVLPGFIDAHIHLLMCGLASTAIDLRKLKSIAEIKEKVNERVKRKSKGEWVVGQGWDDTILTERRFPSRWDLDEVSPDNPVIILRVCGHISCLNSKALELANITKQTTPPPGGEIDKDPVTGEPTGILRDATNMMVMHLISYSDEELIEALKSACERAVGVGLTSVHCIPMTSQQVRIFQRLIRQGDLPLRVYLIPLLRARGFKVPWTKIKAVKMILDGSLGGHTAALFKPYTDQPENTGIIYLSKERLQKIVKKIHKAGFQLAIHCIGDRAVQMALDCIEEALRERPRVNHRHRIEHASVLNKELIERMKNLRVIASVQPPFIVSDGRWLIDRLGLERSRFVYPFKTLLDRRVKVAAGSDCPVELMNPLLGIQAAVTRAVTKDFIFEPEQRVTVDQAIRMYTIGAAYASFEEDIKGSIEVGKLADLVLLSDDPFSVPSNKIGQIRVEMTIVGGKIVYKSARGN